MLFKFKFVVAVIISSCYIGCAICLFEDDYKGCPEPLSCVRITDCPIGVNSLMTMRSHNLERCGFDDKIEKVCCPSVGIKTGGGELRKSEQACNEYSNEVGGEPTINILGGEDAAPGEFPHMAALGYEKEEGLSWQCGGSLVSNKFVLTAAHCIVKQDGIPPTKVRLGIVNIKGDAKSKPLDFGVFNITVHQQYNRRTKRNDIALLELDTTVAITANVHPACLYQNNDNPEGLVITGWGYTNSNGEPSTNLQKAKLHSVPVEDCSEIYVTRMQEPIIETQICAVSDDGKKDTCQGDSGGPLQVQKQPRSSIYSIVGVTSYGMGCGGITPGVYTRVYSYLEWIENIVWR